jgi:uncharacterized coiled-coil DUF342 family protein
VITKVQPDTQKAESLRNIAKMTLERLKTTDQEKYPTNTLNDYYDIIHKLMEALTLEEGIKFRGEGAHQEIIDYVSENSKLGEQNRQFLQQMRDYRNRISYEGFSVTAEYVRQNKAKILEIISRLK